MPTLNKETKRKRIKKTKKKSNFKVVFLLILTVFIAYFVYGQVKLGVLYKIAGIYEAETGVVEQELAIEKALLLRDETPLLAPGSGVLVILAPEGKRVAEKELLAKIQTYQGEVKEIRAPRSGVVCYHLDGLEGVGGPEATTTLNAVEVSYADYQLKETSQGAQVIKGQPLLKLVNNLKPMHLTVNFDSKHLEQFPTEGKRIEVKFKEQEYMAKIKEIHTRGVNVSALLELERGEFLHERELGVLLVLQTLKGTKIPNTALIDTEDGKAVYKLFTTGYRLVPVKILLQNQEDCIIEGLYRGDRILRNPNKVKDLPKEKF